VGGILDYAAEQDIDEEAPATDADNNTVVVDKDGVVARVYEYTSEEECDHNVDVFRKCIQAVKHTTPGGFAAIKLTALGNPILLERLSTAITAIRGFFGEFDKKQNGRVTWKQFKEGWEQHFVEIPEAELKNIFDEYDHSKEGFIDYVEWSATLTPENLSTMVAQCREEGVLYQAALHDDELVLYHAMRRRLYELADVAKENGVRMMVDAEQSYFQPAIDSMVLELQREYNRDSAVVFNTYQLYTHDSLERMGHDLQRAKKLDFKFGAKLVRGAYMESERKRAEDMGYDSPIHQTLEDTHECYDSAVSLLLEDIAAGSGAEVMVASHNQRSVQLATEAMTRLGISSGNMMGEGGGEEGEEGAGGSSTDGTGGSGSNGGVYFGQLLGMADQISFTLGRQGYSVYKYVPYGKLEEVVPYLMRRAQENSSVAGSAGAQATLIAGVLRKRVLGW
jgi:proline dehydrogenase